MTATESQPRPGSGQMFDRIAPRYDLLNRVLSVGIDRRWRRALVDAVKLPRRGALLDLATGTGDVAIAALGRYPESSVLGTDPSANMLAIARKKSEQLGLGERAAFALGSAESIDLPDNAVNAVTMAFGIRNATDRAQSLREANRVTKPGGRIAILELSEPGTDFVGRIAGFHVHHVVPTLGALLSGKKEYRYLQQSIAAFPSAQTFSQMMSDAGMEEVTCRALTFGVAHLYVGVAR